MNKSAEGSKVAAETFPTKAATLEWEVCPMPRRLVVRWESLHGVCRGGGRIDEIECRFCYQRSVTSGEPFLRT